MNVRELQQLLSFVLGLLIVIDAVISWFTKPDKRESHVLFSLYGFIVVGFFAVLQTGSAGHGLAPTKSLIKDSLISAWMTCWVLRDIWRIRNGHGK